jgi:hypothetical protein
MRIPIFGLSLQTLVTVLLFASCKFEDPAESESIATAESASAQTQWDLAAVEATLQAAGTHPVYAAEPVRQPFMRVPGTLFSLGASEIQIYVYPDEAARLHDTHALDPHLVAPPHMMITWRMPPTLIVSGNLAAILLTRDAALRDRVHHALAHPPSASH